MVDVVGRFDAARRRVRVRDVVVGSGQALGDQLVPERLRKADVRQPRVEVAELPAGDLGARRIEPALADLDVRPRRDRLDDAVDLLARRRGILVWHDDQTSSYFGYPMG